MSDLIRRQDAIDALSEDVMGGLNYRRILQSLPSAEPKTRWIPVNKRLPEEFYVLCCDNHGEMIIANPFKCNDSDTGFSAENDECYMYNCIAWMPLPESYKGGEE